MSEINMNKSCIDLCGKVHEYNDFKKIKIAVELLKLKRDKIKGSIYYNELIVLQEKEFNNVPEDISRKVYPSLGFWSNGRDKFFYSHCEPMFEKLSLYDDHRYIGCDTNEQLSLTYDIFTSLIEINEETLKQIDELYKEYEKNNNIYYELDLLKDRQKFYMEDKYLGGNNFVFIEIKKNYGSRHSIEVDISGVEFKFNTLLNEFKDEYEKSIKKEIIEFAVNNKIIKLDNGYVVNNKYFETLDEIEFKDKGEE